RLHDIEGSDGRQKSLSEFLIFAMAGGLILLVWLNKPQDYVHLAVLYWPLVALSVFHAHDVLSGHRRRKWIALAIFIIPMLTFAGYSGRLLQKFHEQYDIFLEMERARIYVSSEEAVMLDQVVKYIHENSEADEAVAILPYFPMAHFLANRLGPHRSAYIVWPFPEIPNRDEAIVESMEALETDLVIYNFTQFYSFDPVWEHAPVLFEYLVDNFTIHRVFNTENWVRPPVALGREVLEVDSPVAQILSVNQEGASLWVEQKSAPPRFVSPDVREVYLKEMLWPFRRVIALRPSSGGRESVFSVPLHVPKGGAHLKTAFAVHPQWWSELSSTWVEFGLRLRVGDEVIPLHRQRLEPSRFFQDRAWFELDIDLGEWAGQDVRVEFLNSAGSPRGESLWMAGWEQPEVTVSLQGDGDSANLGLGEDWTEGSSEN
ncbi:MAG: hypothetical protein CL917_15620, partial [Deltaproteobacteria bacterium]|nr:hypothetical protein [Deltaproteobacteria bacterium]